MSLEVTGLCKRYRRRTAGFAVKNLSFKAENGEILALIGQNGAGKTTTIKCILNFIKKTSGEIMYDGRNVSEFIKDNLVGYMPENLIYPGMTSLDAYLNDIAVLRGLSHGDVRGNLDGLISYLDLEKHRGKYISDFSKGMKQKAGFIQAVFFGPRLLILDEPTDGLDPVARRKILDYIKKLSQSGTTVIITSHILADLERICDRVVLLSDGTLVKDESVSEILSAAEKSGARPFAGGLEDWYFEALGGLGEQNE